MTVRHALAAFALLTATITSTIAVASCVNPNECLCGHNVVVRSVDPSTPWIVEILQVLRADTQCPVAVGDELELHQIVDPNTEQPNLGLAGSGDPLSSYVPPTSGDMGSGNVAVRPDLPADMDLIASIDCRELRQYLIIDGDQAMCGPIRWRPESIPPQISAEDALEANASDDCDGYVAQLFPPFECNDVIVHTSSGCSAATGSSDEPLLLVVMLGLVLRARRTSRND